ncbi:TIGR04282 family arsenosugar biosynthesis glycosyltransferase [Winogradskya humida]|uniref:Glycosyltransferase n=1 Tax=Winogradskya humida TaxID=113566 RepID=A0ABQ4A193_9ACTN|nr:TIGR04282 family arsenosugar biosynthesis glycosyltransferase [Actinoplanes humidus]GIE24619.1 hypothetical protein Ahu01nite_077210 [Actinoplanes humidus]
MRTRLLVLAKTPVPGRVKTRLCPPCTPAKAATLAAAALADTVDTVSSTTGADPVLVIEGDLPAPAGWGRVPQRGGSLGSRIANAFADTAVPGMPSLLIGMDTPQLTPALLEAAIGLLAGDGSDAVLGLAEDGGWWALGLRDPACAELVHDVPTSTSQTGELTLKALQGLRIARLPVLRDVDTIEDARAVAAMRPESRFAGALAARAERQPAAAPR